MELRESVPRVPELERRRVVQVARSPAEHTRRAQVVSYWVVVGAAAVAATPFPEALPAF